MIKLSLLIFSIFMGMCGTSPGGGETVTDGEAFPIDQVEVAFSGADAVSAVEAHLERTQRRVMVNRKKWHFESEWLMCNQYDFDLGQCSDIEFYPRYGRKRVQRRVAEWVTENASLPSSTRLVATRVNDASWSVKASFSLPGGTPQTSVWDVTESSGVVVERTPDSER